MSPILVRPVREQLEHDRIIRLLHAKFRRKYEAAMNPGMEQSAAVGAGTTALYPDLLLMSLDRGHKLQVMPTVAGGMNAIQFHNDGSMSGAACWRADGSAAALGGGLARAGVRFVLPR